MARYLTNAIIVNEGKRFCGYVAYEGGIITAVGEGEPTTGSNDTITDLEGKLLMPGAIDTHVHFREPGLTVKADIASESLAAVSGGVTSFIDMPNCKPVTTCREALEDKLSRAAATSRANYGFFIGATGDNLEELKNCSDISAGVKVFLGASTGNMLVEDDGVLDKIFSLPEVISVHSEDQQTITDNSAAYAERFGKGYIPVRMHAEIRSREACIKCTAKALERALRNHTRLNLLHISTKEELEMIRKAKQSESGEGITAEACVSYLWFCDDDYDRLGARIKCNPAIKSKEDREALLQAIDEGIIDIVSTDHAPHLLSDKEGDALIATSGMPSIQFSLSVMLELARRGNFTIERVVETMCHNPARIFGIEGRGFIREGMAADLVVVDTDCYCEISDTDAVSKCGWTPFAGSVLHNRVAMTLVNGVEVFPAGIEEKLAAQALKFNK